MLFPDQSTEPGSIEFVIDPSYLAGIQLTYLVDILPFLHMIVLSASTSATNVAASAKRSEKRIVGELIYVPETGCLGTV
jgi:hypothetical protein